MKRNQIPGVPYTGKTHPLPVPQKPAVVLQPQTYRELQQGINLVAQAVRPTLGPMPRLGVALLNAQTALRNLPAKHDEAKVAYKILARALEEPMRAMATNAGAQPDIILEKVKARPPGSWLRCAPAPDRRFAPTRDSGFSAGVETSARNRRPQGGHGADDRCHCSPPKA